MKCKVCDCQVNHYNSIFFPERMNEKDNFPCFVLCFSCSDKLSDFFVNRKYLMRRELFGKILRQPPAYKKVKKHIHIQNTFIKKKPTI